MQKLPSRFYASLFTLVLLPLFQISTAHAVTFTEQGGTRLIQPAGSVLQDVRSISFADIDNDGDPDMLMQGTTTGRRMFLNNHFGGGTDTFTMITTGPVSASDGIGFSSAWGDYDGDGLVDCFLGENNTGIGSASAGDLYHNNGGTFTNVSASTVNDPGFAQSVAFADLNHDGRLDVIIGMEGPELHEAYMQNSNGTFTQAGATLGLQVPFGYKAYGLAIGDTDGDGDLDMYISTCIDTGSIRNNFFENITSNTAFGFAFTDIADTNGTQNLPNSYAAGFYDFDDDGDLDLFMVGADGTPSKIFINNGNNQFTDLDAIKGHALLTTQGSDFNGGEAIDYDNDGYLDLYFHDHLSSPFNESRRLYHNNGDMTFTDVTVAVGLGGTNEGGYDSAWADVDMDGDLDLACATNTLFPERLFINDASTNGNHWLSIRLHGNGQNTRAIGAQVYATIHKNTAQQRTLRRDANSNALAFHQSDLPVHFGLGNATVVDDLTIKWPDGGQTILHDVTPNQNVTITEPVGNPCDVTTGTLGDCNSNGILDSCEIISSPQIDCDNNGVIDNCELAGRDCNLNERLDSCDIATSPGLDCNHDGAIDQCELATTPTLDCNNNDILDSCDIAASPTIDCDNNGEIDQCELAILPVLDCNENGQLDQCDIAAAPSLDCDQNGAIDSCEIAEISALDCNNNGLLDQCEIATTPSLDCNLNGTIDSCEPVITPICVDDFTTGTFDQTQWLPLGLQDETSGKTAYDEFAGAFIATVFNDGSQYRVTGVFENSSDCIPYSAVGTANYVRGKFYVYHGGQSPNSQNHIPMLRVRLATRFAVTSMLELQSHVDVDPVATAVAADIMPSADPAKPSLYRVDFDPVDVPALSNPGDQGKLLRGFEAFAFSVQDNGYLALTEVTASVYPASSLPANQAPDLVLTTGTVDAGTLHAYNYATDVMLETYNTTGPADVGIPRPTYTEGPEGVTLDSTQVPGDLLGIAAREFNPGPATGLSEHLRVEPCKIYKVRFHVTSTQQTNLNAQLRWRARSVRFNWTQKFQIGGAYPAGDLTNQIAQQALPGIGCQNPDKIGNENGGWYTLLMNTPLSNDIRPEFPDGTPLSVRMPNLSAQPGPGVSAPSLRDIRVAADIVDTNDHDIRATLEAGNMTVDRIEIRSYPLEND